MANYKGRELKAANYIYVEYCLTRRHYREGETRSSDTYEVMPLAGISYRRWLAHNDQPLPEQDEQQERQKLALAIHKYMDEEVRLPYPGAQRNEQHQAFQADQPDPLLAEMQSEGLERQKSRDASLKSVDDKTSILGQQELFTKGLTDLRLPLELLPDIAGWFRYSLETHGSLGRSRNGCFRSNAKTGSG